MDREHLYLFADAMAGQGYRVHKASDTVVVYCPDGRSFDWDGESPDPSVFVEASRVLMARGLDFEIHVVHDSDTPWRFVFKGKGGMAGSWRGKNSATAAGYAIVNAFVCGYLPREDRKISALRESIAKIRKASVVRVPMSDGRYCTCDCGSDEFYSTVVPDTFECVECECGWEFERWNEAVCVR